MIPFDGFVSVPNFGKGYLEGKEKEPKTTTACVACLNARNEMGSFFFPLIVNMLVVSITFLPGKVFCDFFFLSLWIDRVRT